MMKRILKLYFNSWWLPALLFLVILGCFTIIVFARWKFLAFISKGLFYLAGLAFLGIVAASIWNLIKKQWAKAVINIILLFICGTTTIVALMFLMLGPSKDGFADNLEIPPDVEVAEPGEKLGERHGTGRDAFQVALLATLQTTGSTDTTIVGTISALQRLQESHGAILRRYLASSPAWRVFEEHGNVFATRRWMIGSEWRYKLHGYYSRHDIYRWSHSETPDFQTRVTIGLSGKPWWRGNKDTTWLGGDEKTKSKLSPIGDKKQGSHCVVSADSIVVEVFEQSEAPERRLTKAALDFLQTELQPLVESPSWDTVRQILPADSIRRGEPSFDIRKSFQPGIYDSVIWVNPGESGMIYLKAFEVTKGTPLSVNRLKKYSNEWIGWSDDPEELFFSNTHFTIYEGDWGKPYAARMEVWFDPDSGDPDRKLMEKVFKIEGWQR